MEATEEDKNRGIVVYVGRYVNAEKLDHKYIVETTGEVMLFGEKLLATAVGGRMEVEFTEKGVRKPYRYIGNETNQEKITTWSIADRLAYDEHSLKAKMKKAQPTRYDDIVDELRDMYRDTSPAQKQLFINRVITDIIKSR